MKDGWKLCSAVIVAFCCVGAFAQRVVHEANKPHDVERYAEPMDDLTVGDCYGQFDFLGGGWIDIYFQVAQEALYEIVLKARGQPALGEQPAMELRVGKQKIGYTTVASRWQDYGFPCLLKPGTHRLRIFFTNDYFNEETEIDRNLYLDTFLFRKRSKADGDVILRREFARRYPGRTVMWIRADPVRPDRLWVAVKDGFLVRFEPRELFFSDFYEHFKLMGLRPPTVVEVIFTDESVWVGTGAGLFEYDRRRASLELYAPAGSRIAVESLAFEDDVLKVGVKGKMLSFELKRRRWLEKP